MSNIAEIYGEGNLIRTSDVPENKALNCKITATSVRQFGDRNKLVLELETGKSFVCNKTNANRLAKIYNTPEYDKWVGKTFLLVRDFTQFKGQDIECLRVQRQFE